ncbi:MAG: ribosome-associated translation inhibitor RaiA [Proteobacteria bacterium]|nr:ribosome-associated translation inhibitor RaiA [Cystobacterineae bacterium]MCL2259073.1 ribosome-associated translation inhibitor RaiA [Cystobacterineae bacterium]MCL2314825.1 ribosome-associated translation inhibitor RaiA [Pseudomonadota bacterium]
MQMNITFRHMDSIDSLKNYAKDKVEKANKYLDRAGEAYVVLSLERHLHQADITITSGPFVLRGREKSEDMYASIDKAMERIEKQLRRYKDRLKSHNRHERPPEYVHEEAEMHIRHDVMEVSEVEESGIALNPRVIKTNEFVTKPMTVDEAVMQMDLLDNDFIVFTNTQSAELNVIYRRKDGHYGLIEATRPPPRQPPSVAH